MQAFSSPVGAKFQVTLPKKVREALGIRKAGDLLGFLLDGSRVTLAKAEVRPVGDSFTEEEWAKLFARVKGAPKKTYSGKEFIARHKKLTEG